MKTAVQLVTVDENHNGQRIDNFLMSQLKGLPRSVIYRIVLSEGSVPLAVLEAQVDAWIEAQRTLV